MMGQRTVRKYKLGFVGAGNIAEAICRAVVSNNVFSPVDITAHDPLEDRCRYFREAFGTGVSGDNPSLVSQSDTIILACKPQQIAEVLAEVRSALGSDHLVISVAAGVSTGFIHQALGKDVPIVRIMPNTPLLVGSGATAMCKGPGATDDHLAVGEMIFGSAGIVVTIQEIAMDAVTAVSGSGPAYFFYLIEAMVQAGVELGLSRNDALRLSAQTCLGSGRMILQMQADPESLRRRVTSPGGTTESALAVLEAEGVRKAFTAAIKAAAQRSAQLGQ